MDTSLKKLPQQRPPHGFTLVELMVTIVIVGILTTVAFPAFRELIANQRIKSASFDLMSTINLARSEAIKRNGQVIITPSGGNWGNGWSITTNIPAATTILNQAAMNGLNITCYDTPPTPAACSTITFLGNGRTNNQPQFILVSTDTITTPKVTCINVDLSGMPKSKKASC